MIGVIITLGEAEDGITPAAPSRINPGADLTKWDVLGASVLQRFLHSLENIAPHEVAFLSDSHVAASEDAFRIAGSALPGVASTFSSWEEAAQAFLCQGVQTLLLVKLNQYIEVDLTDLLRFHEATASKLTQVFLGNQPVSIVVVKASEFHTRGASLRRQLVETIPHRRRYQSKGYFNPLSGLDDFRQLYADAFANVCRLRPIGQEIAPGLYVSEDVSIHSTVTISGPAYIGARGSLATGCLISGPVSIEHGCQVDCGTSLENCFVSHNTYLGPGLNLKNALAGPGWLYNMEHKTVVTINDPRLLGETHARHFLGRAKSLLSQTWPQRSMSTFR